MLFNIRGNGLVRRRRIGRRQLDDACSVHCVRLAVVSKVLRCVGWCVRGMCSLGRCGMDRGESVDELLGCHLHCFSLRLCNVLNVLLDRGSMLISRWIVQIRLIPLNGDGGVLNR